MRETKRMEKHQEIEIVEKWYKADELTESEKRLKERVVSLHNFQLRIALKRMFAASSISNTRTIGIMNG